MKLMLDERVKHRFIGLAVILSIGAIFIPAIMKKSNQRIDENVSVSVELPPKPIQPDVNLTEKKAMFEQVRVAHVEIPDVGEEQPRPTLVKAESLSHASNLASLTEANNEVIAQHEEVSSDATSFANEEDELTKEAIAPVASLPKAAVIHKIAKAEVFSPKAPAKIVAKNSKLLKPVAKPKLSVAKPKTVKPLAKAPAKLSKRGGYAVQLATFSQQINAESLISRLKGKGYSASYNKVKTREGFVYKVVVGQVNKKEQAQELQKRLANALSIRGFIVTTGQG